MEYIVNQEPSGFAMNTHVYPRISTTSQLFYKILMSNQYGPPAHIAFMLLEHSILMALTTRLSLDYSFLSNKLIYIELLNPENLSAQTISTISACIALLYLFIFYLMIRVFKIMKIQEDSKSVDSNTSNPNKKKIQSSNGKTSDKNQDQIFSLKTECRILSYIFGCFNECFGLFTQIYVAVCFFWVQNTTSKNELYQPDVLIQNTTSSISSSSYIILLGLLGVIQLEVIIFSLFERIFYNFKFRNASQINARHADGIMDYLHPVNSLIICYVCLKPVIDHFDKIIIQTGIIILSLLQLWFGSIITQKYFNNRLQQAEMLTTIFSLSFYETNVIMDVLRHLEGVSMQQRISGHSILDTFLVFLFLFLVNLGIAMTLQKRRKNYVINKLQKSITLNEPIKDQKVAEFAIYLILDCLDAEDNIDNQQKFNEILISSEEMGYNEASYALILSKILKDSSDIEETETKRKDYLLNKIANTINDKSLNNYLAQQTSQGLNLQDSHIFGIEESCTMTMEYGKQNATLKLSSKTLLASSFGFNSRQIPVGDPPDAQNHQLVDVFQNELYGNNNLRGDLGRQKGLFEDALKLLQMKANTNISEKEALRLIKIKFLYDVIVKKCLDEFPNSCRLMLSKACIAESRLKNKYLSLTTITHLNLHSKRKESYLKQIQTKISETFFVELCQPSKLSSNSPQAITNQEEALSNWNEADKIIDANVLLLHNLEVNRILKKVKDVTTCIGQFWSLYNSQNMNKRQFKDFLTLSELISEMLKDIRACSDLIENPNYSYKSDHLCFVLSQFYSTVLKDTKQGKNIGSHLELFSLISQKTSSPSENYLDEIGMLVVDGNFDLYGKILFGNQLVLKLLAYKAEDILDRTVHKIMPKIISDIHNYFWRSFSSIGQPKVLDKVRFLFTKDSRGYVNPVKVLIKFQYTVQYGYCFLGILKKPKEIIFENVENPIKIPETYQIICNERGKILEISHSCRELFGITPSVVEQLHAQLEQNLLISILNPFELVLSDYDWNASSCYYFKMITLDYGKLQRMVKNCEINDLDENDNFPARFNRTISNINGTQFTAQMKIVREIYGYGSLPEPLQVFYIFFAEAPIMDDITFNENATRPTGAVASAFSFDSRNQRSDSNISAIDGHQNDLNKTNKEDQTKSNYASQSQCSLGSQVSTVDSGIKLMDEGFDDQRSPTLLIGLKTATTLLIFLLIILSVVQYVMSSNQKMQDFNNEQVLLKTFQATEYLTEIEILCRSYLNINLGLEPNSSQFILDRAKTIKEVAINLIEEMEIKLRIIKDFFGSQVDEPKGTILKDVTVYSMMPNSTVEVRMMPKFYSINLWLVYVQEMFSYPMFNSTIGTFLHNTTYIGKANTSDEVAFFVTINALTDIMKSFSSMIESEQEILNQVVNNGINLSLIITVVSTFIILLSSVASVYLTIMVLSFKHKLLSHFDNLQTELVLVQEKSAIAFNEYVISNNQTVLIELENQLAEFNHTGGGIKIQFQPGNAKKEVLMNQNSKQSMDSERKDNEASASPRIRELEQSLDIEVFKKKTNNSKSPKIESSGGNPLSKLTQPSYKHFKHISKPRQQPKIDENQSVDLEKRGNRRKSIWLPKHHQKQEQSESDEQTQKHNAQKNDFNYQSGLPVPINEIFFKREEREITRLLKNQIKTFTYQIVPIAISIISFLVLYFVIQSVLFQQQLQQIQVNSTKLTELVKSLECQNSLISQIRNMKVSNITKYKLEPFIPDMIYTDLLRENFDYSTGLNITFTQCLRLNQKVQNWLQIVEDGKYFIDGNEGNTICKLFMDNKLLAGFTEESCIAGYQGILKKTALQSTSLFMQDAIYSAIKFMTKGKVRDQEYIRDGLSSSQQIELLDTHTFYQQTSLRFFYNHIIDSILESQSSDTAVDAIFSIYICCLLIALTLIHIVLFSKMKKHFWNSLYMLQLLPRDNLSRDFITQLNKLLINT